MTSREIFLKASSDRRGISELADLIEAKMMNRETARCWYAVEIALEKSLRKCRKHGESRVGYLHGRFVVSRYVGLAGGNQFGRNEFPVMLDKDGCRTYLGYEAMIADPLKNLLQA